jgi:O-antigen ligase
MQANAAGDSIWILAAALLLLPLAFAICLRLPALVTLSLLTILLTFSSSTWGQLDIDNTIYARGTGLFYFSLLNLLLWTAAAACLIRQLLNPQLPVTPSPFPLFFMLFLCLLTGHMVLGLMADKDTTVILGYNGIINVGNMLLFCLLLMRAIETESHRRQLLFLLLGLAAMRAVYGMVRYLWLGGDNANPYRNFENLDIKLFYFDIADNYVAALAAFCIAWLLLMPQVHMALPKRLLLLALLTLEIAAVALSFRRSSLIGLVLMSLVLLWRLPWLRRLQAMAFGSGALALVALAFMRERLQFNSNSENFLTSLLYDVAPGQANEAGRFYELEAAAHSLQGNWLFGLGSWGTFYGDEDILDYHFGKFDFVHSGFGHLLLKSGVVGLALFAALLLVFTLHYVRSRPHLRGNAALLADAGCGSLLFWLPTLLVGTPIIEFRSMLLLGLTLALPYLATRTVQTNAHPASPARYATA